MLPFMFSVIFGAISGPVSISNCGEPDPSWSSQRMAIECDITNTHSSLAISGLRYRVIIRDENRQVPWAETGDILYDSIAIRGGIEPGETVRKHIVFVAPPMDAPRNTMVVEFMSLEVLGPDEQPIK